MQNLLKDLRRKEQEMVAMEAVLEQDFGNGNLEHAYNKAYDSYYQTRRNAAKKIVSITGRVIDLKTAFRMLDQRAAGEAESLLDLCSAELTARIGRRRVSA